MGLGHASFEKNPSIDKSWMAAPSYRLSTDPGIVWSKIACGHIGA
jgi:hypothetical protein